MMRFQENVILSEGNIKPRIKQEEEGKKKRGLDVLILAGG